VLHPRDFGVFTVLKQVANATATGTLYLIEPSTAPANPFDVPETTYAITFECPVVVVKQMGSQAVRSLFGQTNDSFYSVSTPLPNDLSKLKQGSYAIINHMGLQLITGLLERFDVELSGMMKLYINTSVTLDFRPADLGITING